MCHGLLIPEDMKARLDALAFLGLGVGVGAGVI